MNQTLPSFPSATSPLELPLPFPSSPLAAGSAASFAFKVAPALTARLDSLARTHGSSIQTLALAAWAVVLARLSTQDEFLLAGCPGTDTPVRALHLDLRGEPTLAAWLPRLDAMLHDAASQPGAVRSDDLLACEWTDRSPQGPVRTRLSTRRTREVRRTRAMGGHVERRHLRSSDHWKAIAPTST